MTRIRLRDAAGTVRTLSRLRMRDASSTLRTIQRVRGRDGAGTLHTLWQYLTIALDHTVVTGTASGASASGAVTSGNVTGTVSGGTPAFSYTWQYVNGDASIVPTAPTSATTAFTNPDVDSFLGIDTANYQLQVTDSLGNIVVSNEVEVQLHWIDTR